MSRFNKAHRPDHVDKGGRVTTPPLQQQKPKYADKMIVKAVNPKTS